MKPKKKRLTFEFTPEVHLRLQDLKDRTEAPSGAEVIRRALALYDMVATETELGRQLVLRDPENDSEQVIRLL